MSAPAGSGKTFLLRSWISEAGMAESTAWVSVQPGERDPQRFWISVADALRDTAAASELVRLLTDLTCSGLAVLVVVFPPHEAAARQLDASCLTQVALPPFPTQW